MIELTKVMNVEPFSLSATSEVLLLFSGFFLLKIKDSASKLDGLGLENVSYVRLLE